MPDLPRSTRTHGPVVLDHGEVVGWRKQTVPMLTRGVVVGGVPVPRRTVVTALGRAIRAWWDWTIADAGTLFWDRQRDLLIQVHSGVGRGRMVRVLPREAVHYPTVQQVGLDYMFALAPVERSEYTWRDLAPAQPKETL